MKLKNNQDMQNSGSNIFISRSNRHKVSLSNCFYTWNLKNDTNELIYKTETDSQT